MVKKIFKTPELYLFVFLVIGCFFIFHFDSKISNTKITREDTTEEITLPYFEDLKRNENFEFQFDLYSSEKNWRLHVIPDDCVDEIYVENERIDISHFSNLCNFSSGFYISAKNLKLPQSKGHYHFTFKMRNGGGPGGVNIFVLNGALHKNIYTINVILFTLLLLFIFRRFKILPTKYLLLIFTFFFLHLLFFYANDYKTFSHDVDGHVEYIEFLVENKSIPNTDDCWTCYHPPVYYVMSAPIYKIASKTGFFPPRSVQWLSIFLSLVVMILGSKILTLILKEGSLQWSSLLLFNGWPLFYILSPRIGNDQLFFVTHLLTLFACLKYMQKPQGKYLLLGAISVIVGMGTKSTTMISLGIWWVAFLLGYFPREKLLPQKSECFALLTILIFMGVLLVSKISGDSTLVGNAHSLHKALRIKAEFANLIFFDIKDFFTHAFTSPSKDEGGRQFLLNYLSKTALFGEFSLSSQLILRNLAQIISFNFLILCVYAFAGFWKSKFSKINLLLLFQGFAFFAATIYLRVEIPFACSSDFRYIMPILLTFIPFVSLGIFKDDASLKWKTLGLLNLFTFILCSSILYLSL